MRRAIAFLTALGGTGSGSPTPRTLDWFGVVGAGIGLALGGLWWLSVRSWPAPVAAAVVVAADLAMTGLLHFDGLVDAADGLLPHLPRGRRLEVMEEPSVGAFGVGVAGATLLLRWSALAAISPARPLLIAGLWCASRSAMALTARTQRYARPEGGLADAFLAAPSPSVPRAAGVVVVPVVGIIGGVGLATAAQGVQGAASVVAGVAAAAMVVALARSRIGGFTGDVLGALGVVAETLGLVVAAARW
ncbi:MAG: adenosylcobinamide-GDP ribazoletransferase [Acidimicrobiales bacterium]